MFEPVECRVYRASGDIAIQTDLNAAENGTSIGIASKFHDCEKNCLFEGTE